jgi:hypothetical protein
MFRVVGLMVVVATALFALTESKEMFRYTRWYAQWR